MPSLDLAAVGPAPTEVIGHVRAMATDVAVRAHHHDLGEGRIRELVDSALEVFTTVEQECSRFDPESPLMRANALPTEAHELPAFCFEALREAAAAYALTSGRFDPRVLDDLIGLGYDRSLPFAGGEVHLSEPVVDGREPLPAWTPQFRPDSRQVVLGPHPVDLGGIGKGLAVRWASAVLRAHTDGFLVEAGGDCYCGGAAADGGSWRIAVEDPFGGTTPRAVLELRDQACATSSTRLRHWSVGMEKVHHLVDPKTGRPGGDGLCAVTVVSKDPAEAEVWTKALFLAGRNGIDALAQQNSIPALWIDERGEVTVNDPMAPLICWGPW